jgi:hypothetical protein
VTEHELKITDDLSAMPKGFLMVDKVTSDILEATNASASWKIDIELQSREFFRRNVGSGFPHRSFGFVN